MPRQEVLYLKDDPLWYKDAIIYELHIKAFYDSNGDGIGDFQGLTEKLDYLKDLGVTAIWLLPFYPSPRKDDGYDIADYMEVHPDYGTLKDFKDFLSAAHERGLRVITELVLNHTSDQHPWFQKARRAKPGSSAREFYVWSDTPKKYTDARIIFQDFESSNWSWDPVARAYFWHRFYSHQPDLNYDNPQVQKAMFRVIDYWMNMGVDGVRLDAVPYLYEREGTNCENLPETYEFLKQLRAHLDKRFPNRMLLAEANQWPEDAVSYFGRGDECHMAFHFPLMPRMFMALQMEDSYPILNILEQTPVIPDNCQWALFLRNHDELTLEMVTDEERDYMYRMYAKDPKTRINLGIRRRLAPLLNNDRRRMKILYTLLFTLPGTPVIYYGNELGMGDNYYLGDRNGVRTPMQWSPDKNAGFSKANPHQLYLPVIIDFDYHYTVVNVENQERNRSSFLWWMRRFTSLRKHFKALGRGSIELLYPDNPKIFAFIRQYEDESILVAVNLSRHPQVATFDLSKYAGCVPEEMFSKNKFMPIKETPYVLTFAPYSRYMFQCKPEGTGAAGEIRKEELPLQVKGTWEEVFKEDQVRETLESEVLPSYIQSCRWFGGKSRQLQSLNIVEDIPFGKGKALTHILILQVEYTEGLPDTYVLPSTFTDEQEEMERISREAPQAIICRLEVGEKPGLLYDGMYNEEFCKMLLSRIARKRHIKTANGEFVVYPGEAYKNSIKGREYLLKSQVMKAEQSNTSVLYGNEFFLKIYRHPDEGLNPDLEIMQFLTEVGFTHTPSFAGGMEYRASGKEPIVLGILQNYVPNQGDSWKYYLDLLQHYYDRTLTRRGDIPEVPEVPNALLDLASYEIPGFLRELFTDVMLTMTSLIGTRTAEMHLALASSAENPNFAPEPFSLLWQRSVFQSMQSLTKRTFMALRKNIKSLPENVVADATEILDQEKKIIDRLHNITKKKLTAMKTRIHGDYHLGQVLFTGEDFIIIDFEGEPARTLSERRLKRSPLRDVAGMIRSFHYAAYMSLLKEAPLRPADRVELEPWADLWYRCISGTFLKAYFETAGQGEFLPEDRSEIETMLKAFLLDKAVYEIGYELNNRPEWLFIPLRGIKHLLADE